jgi:peptide/nickel transport system substrate-binding protein
MMAAQRESYTETRKGTVGRRRVLTGALAGGAVALTTLAGCRTEQQPAPATTSAPVAQPKRGGILQRMSAQDVLFDLDPHADTPAKARGYHFFYQGLLGYHPETFAAEAELAQKWEQPDNLTYVFSLQPGVKWHNKPPANGRLLTSADVVFSLERVRENNPRHQSRALIQGVKIEAVDNATVRLTTQTPDAGFINKLSGDSIVMVAPEVVERAGKWSDAEVAVGTGPFMLKTRTEGTSAEYERNPDYWKPGLPYLDGIRTSFFAPSPPDARAYAAFIAGQLDVVVVPGNEVKGFLARQGSDAKPLWYRADSMYMATPNVEVKPMDDARVTKALRLLVDHDEQKTAWADIKIGKGVDGAFLPPSVEPWDLKADEFKGFLEWKQPKDDAAREALSLLSAAGFTRSNPLKFEIVSDDGVFGDCSELLHAQFRQLSQGVVTPDLKRLPFGPGLEQIRNSRQFTFMVIGNGGTPSEIDAVLTGIYRSNASRNLWGYKDATLDNLIDRQRAIFDETQRKAAVREVNLRLIDQHPGVILANRWLLNATQPYVRNFFPELFMYGRPYESIWLDR